MTLRYLKIGALAAAALAAPWAATGGAGAGRALHPDLRLPHRRLRSERHPHRRRLQGLLHAAQRARRRHRGREDHPRGVRDQLRHQGRRGVLRAAEEQEPAHDQPLLDRHHLRADPEGAGRQDPDPVDGLRAHRRGGRQRARLGVHHADRLLEPVDGQDQVHRLQGGRSRQAQGQEDHQHLSQQPLRQGDRSPSSTCWPRSTASRSSTSPSTIRARSRRRPGSRFVSRARIGSSSAAGA